MDEPHKSKLWIHLEIAADCKSCCWWSQFKRLKLNAESVTLMDAAKTRSEWLVKNKDIRPISMASEETSCLWL